MEIKKESQKSEKKRYSFGVVIIVYDDQYYYFILNKKRWQKGQIQYGFIGGALTIESEMASKLPPNVVSAWEKALGQEKHDLRFYSSCEEEIVLSSVKSVIAEDLLFGNALRELKEELDEAGLSENFEKDVLDNSVFSRPMGVFKNGTAYVKFPPEISARDPSVLSIRILFPLILDLDKEGSCLKEVFQKNSLAFSEEIDSQNPPYLIKIPREEFPQWFGTLKREGESYLHPNNSIVTFASQLMIFQDLSLGDF